MHMRASSMMAPFTFCPVCRTNHDKGKGHKYSAKHKQHLAVFLSKARSKSGEIRSSLKEVAFYDDRNRTNFWCVFCEQEVDEKESSFNRESAIQHLGGSSHFTNVKRFFSKHGADLGDVRRYVISNEELTKWQEQCKVLKAKMASSVNNIHSDDPGSSLALGTRHVVNSHVASVDDVHPLLVLTLASSQKPVPRYDGASSVATANEGHQWFPMSPASRSAPRNLGIEASTSQTSDHYNPASSNEILNRSRDVDPDHHTQAPGARLPSAQFMLSALPAAFPLQYTVMATGQDLSKVVCPPLLPGEGNIHSGATPPWITPGVDEKLLTAPSTEISPSMKPVTHQPISKGQERKLAKLRPPNRVGAAWAEMRRAQLERESLEGVPQAATTWLPNFGRVWQSGSRHDTRKEFEAEKRREAKRLGRPLGKTGATSSESPVQIQPYVSKRQRADKTDE